MLAENLDSETPLQKMDFAVTQKWIFSPGILGDSHNQASLLKTIIITENIFLN